MQYWNMQTICRFIRTILVAERKFCAINRFCARPAHLFQYVDAWQHSAIARYLRNMLDLSL